MNNFEKTKKEFIEDYIIKEFPRELKVSYGDVIGVLKVGIEAGIRFTKSYYSINENDR